MSKSKAFKIQIDAAKASVSICHEVLKLEPLEFVYYRYFVERAKCRQSSAKIDDPKFSPEGFLCTILKYFDESFPQQERTHERLEKHVRENKEITVREFRSKISRINSKIRRLLSKASCDIDCEIRTNGPQKSRNYFVNCPPEWIDIKGSTVGNRFRKRVFVFSENRTLAAALRMMNDNDFDQVVVRQNGRLTLLTVVGIARWLAASSGRSAAPIDHVPITEVLAFEPRGSVKIVPANTDIAEMRSFFTNRLTKDSVRLHGILITPNGHEKEEAIGIITPWDFLRERNW
jgi:CBS domain-containing protein